MIDVEFELTQDELRGAARTRAFAAVTALGVKRIALLAGDEVAAKGAMVAAREAKLAVVAIVEGGAPAGRCPNDAKVRAAAVERAGVAATRLAPAAVELCGFGFPDSRAAASGAARFLEALCTCEGCARRLATRQLDATRIASKVKKLIETARAEAGKESTPLERPEEIGPWLVKQLGAMESAALLSVRRESLVALVQEVQKALPKGVVLQAVAHPSPFAGGRALGGGLLALTDWLESFTLELAATDDPLDAPRLAAIVKSARTAAMPTSRFTLRLPMPPLERRTEQVAALRAAAKEGLAGVRLVGAASWPDNELVALRGALSR